MNELEKDLLSRDSFVAINDVLPGKILHPKQCIDVIRCLYGKKCIVSYDTGTGKTLIASSVIRLLLNEDPTRRFLIMVKNSQLIQTDSEIQGFVREKGIVATGDEKFLEKNFYGNNASDHKLVFITPSALLNEGFAEYLFRTKDRYCGLIIDEAHEVSNKQHARTASILDGLCRQLEYVIALTATPITTDVVQLARLAGLVNHNLFPNHVKLRKDLENYRVSPKDFPFMFINRNGEDFGRVTKPKGYAIAVQPMIHQRDTGLGGVALMQQNRGVDADSQHKAMHDFILERKSEDKRGLVFVSQHEVREALLSKFPGGYSYGVAHGETSKEDRVRVMDKFNVDKTTDVVFTSLTTSLHLDCDYVVFYEFTSDVKQMIGRAHRGLYDKELEVFFMITMCKEEMTYFKENIYDIAIVVEMIMDKDYSEIKSVKRQLDKKQGDC